MLDKNQLSDVLAVALQHGGDFADVFIERRVSTAIACEENRIERIKTGMDAGAGIRVMYGDTTAYAYTNKLTKDELLAVADLASRAVKKAKRSTRIDLRSITPEWDLDIKEMPDLIPVEDKVEVVKAANRAARSFDPRIRQVMIGYGDVVQDVTIANSLGRLVEDRRVRTRIAVNAMAAHEGQIQTGFEALGGAQGFELVNEDNCAALGREAARRAITLLEAKPAPAGRMPVVMAGEAGGTMVHEASGHGLEADLVQKGLSVYAGQLGQMVASKLITVVDDGKIPRQYGTLRFDDEGFASQKTVLIQDGCLKSYMYDYLTSVKDGVSSTGNGRRESFEHKPIPRMRNTYIAPGKEAPETIIKSVKQGLLVKKMGGGQVNTINGDFVFDVAEGYLIQDGEVGQAVRGATLTGNGPEVLKMVDRIGKDFGFTIGTCGKDGQGAPVSDAQPTLHIPQMIVGGTAHEPLERCCQLEPASQPVKWKIRRI